MNPRWLLIRRLRGPAFLLTFGLTAVLSQWGALSFGRSWPLYLIVAGVLTLLERAALTTVDPSSYPGTPYPAQSYQPGWTQTGPPAAPSTSIVPSEPHDIHPEGRQ